MNLKERIAKILGKKGIDATEMSEAELGDAIGKLFDGASFASESDFKTLKSDFETLKGSFDTLQEGISTIKTYVSEIATKVEKDTGAISSLESTVAEIIGQEAGNAAEPEKTPEEVIDALMQRVKDLEKGAVQEGGTTVTAKIKKK